MDEWMKGWLEWLDARWMDVLWPKLNEKTPNPSKLPVLPNTQTLWDAQQLPTLSSCQSLPCTHLQSIMG